MRRNWIAGCLGAAGLALIAYSTINEAGDLETTMALPSGAGPVDAATELAGEPPLFAAAEPILASLPSAGGTHPEDGPRVGMFEPVAADSWVVRALHEVFPEELAGVPGETPAGVTRYELAVALAKVFEVWKQRSEKGEGPDPARLDALEKLTGELRKELSVLGIDTGSLQVQLAALGDRVGKVEDQQTAQAGRVGELEKQIQVLSRKLEAESSLRASLETRAKAMSDVLGRLVVKTAVVEARSKTPAASSEAPQVAELARRVDGIEKDLAARPVSDEGAARITERLQRVERLIVKAYRERGSAGSAGADEARLALLQRGMAELKQRIQAQESRLETAAAPTGPRKVDGRALDDVKDLMKGFFKEFDARLGKVEKQVL